MGIVDYCIIAIVVAILGLAGFYIYRKQKRGGCIGCPQNCECNGNCSCCSGHICEK